MNKTAKQIIDEIIGVEGGYVDNPKDPGGATRWGVTQRVARAHGYTGDMRNLPRDTAFNILMSSYYIDPRFDQIEAVVSGLGAKLADCGVNMGPSVPAKFLQRLLNALNREQKDYPDLIADGMIGSITINALRRLVAKRGVDGARTVLMRGVNCLQGAEYLRQTEANEKKEEFFYGWLFNRID